METEGNFVNRIHILSRDHRISTHVTEKRNLGFQFLVQGPVRAAEQDVRLNTDGPQLLDAVLGGLCFHLARRLDIRNQGHVDKKGILPADIKTELPDRLKKRQTLNVADGTADFNESHICVALKLKNSSLYLISDMGNHLDGAAQIFAPALLGDHRVVDAARGVIIFLAQLGLGIALVMA